MNKRFKIITLCGSTRFKDEFIKTQERLALEGNIVLSVDIFSKADGISMTHNDTIISILDEMHKVKIDMSDAIFVINKNGYIGKSTESEIEYAKSLGKEIMYLENPNEENKDMYSTDDIKVSLLSYMNQSNPENSYVKITIIPKNEEDVYKIANRIHTQLVGNKDYINSNIVVNMGEESDLAGKVINIFIMGTSGLLDEISLL